MDSARVSSSIVARSTTQLCDASQRRARCASRRANRRACDSATRKLVRTGSIRRFRRSLNGGRAACDSRHLDRAAQRPRLCLRGPAPSCSLPGRKVQIMIARNIVAAAVWWNGWRRHVPFARLKLRPAAMSPLVDHGDGSEFQSSASLALALPDSLGCPGTGSRVLQLADAQPSRVRLSAFLTIRS